MKRLWLFSAILTGPGAPAIGVGGGHACGRAVDGTWCWRTSSNGQLGTGIDTGVLVSFLTPQKVRFP